MCFGVRCRANVDSDEIVEPILKYFLVSFNLFAFVILFKLNFKKIKNFNYFKLF